VASNRTESGNEVQPTNLFLYIILFASCISAGARVVL
jgi:hypothetical protein